MKLAAVPARLPEPQQVRGKRIGKTLLEGKPYNPAASHSDPKYMTGRMDHYRKLYGPKEK